MKRLEWAREHLEDDFEDVLWMDETSVQLETHRRFCCRKDRQKPRRKPRPKHPVKVHAWVGISWRGSHGDLHICRNHECMQKCTIEVLFHTLVPKSSLIYSGQPQTHLHEFLAVNW